jgi:hypothetical protein
MNRKHILTALALAGMISAPLSQASAERVKQNSAKANAAFEACGDQGAVTIESEGVTSCIAGNGHGIVCGGVDKAVQKDPGLKGTCDTFRRAPKNPWGVTADELARVNVVKATKPVMMMKPRAN